MRYVLLLPDLRAPCSRLTLHLLQRAGSECGTSAAETALCLQLHAAPRLPGSAANPGVGREQGEVSLGAEGGFGKPGECSLLPTSAARPASLEASVSVLQVSFSCQEGLGEQCSRLF